MNKRNKKKKRIRLLIIIPSIIVIAILLYLVIEPMFSHCIGCNSKPCEPYGTDFFLLDSAESEKVYCCKYSEDDIYNESNCITVIED